MGHSPGNGVESLQQVVGRHSSVAPLLDQVLADRGLGFDSDAPPRPGSLGAAHEFAACVAQVSAAEG